MALRTDEEEWRDRQDEAEALRKRRIARAQAKARGEKERGCPLVLALLCGVGLALSGLVAWAVQL